MDGCWSRVESNILREPETLVEMNDCETTSSLDRNYGQSTERDVLARRLACGGHDGGPETHAI